MDWSKVIYVFFALMSLTTIVGFLVDQSEITLFVAASISVITTLLKLGVRNILTAELFATSLVSDLHLIPAFIVMVVYPQKDVLVLSLAAGAIVANVFSLALVIIESAKQKNEF